MLDMHLYFILLLGLFKQCGIHRAFTCWGKSPISLLCLYLTTFQHSINNSDLFLNQQLWNFTIGKPTTNFLHNFLCNQTTRVSSIWLQKWPTSYATCTLVVWTIPDIAAGDTCTTFVQTLTHKLCANLIAQPLCNVPFPVWRSVWWLLVASQNLKLLSS